MIALSLATMAGIALVYNPRAVFGKLHNVDWTIALIAIVGLAVVHLLQVELWRVMSVALNRVTIPRRFAVTAYFTGQALGGLTPGNLGGDVYRTLAVRTASGNWREAAGPILAQRVISYGTVLLLAALAGGLSLAAGGGLLVPVVLGCALSLIILGAARFRLRLLIFQASEIVHPKYVYLLRRAMSAYRAALGLGVAFHLTSVGLMYVLLVSVGETPPLLATLAALLVTRAVSLLPITPFGFGLQEGSLVLLLPTLGVSPESALAVSLLARLGMLLAIGIGLACFAFDRLRPESESREVTSHDVGAKAEALSAK